MATSTNSMDEPGGWIAFQVENGDSSFWLETKNDVTGILTNSGWAPPFDTPPLDKHFAPIRDMKAEVKREYGGINSSGSLQVTGRADHSDIEIIRTADYISPLLYQFVSTGEQFRKVLVVLRENDGAPRVEWLLEGVNVTSYKFEAMPEWISNRITKVSDSETLSSQYAETLYYRNDTFTLLYTKATLRVGIVTDKEQIHTDFRGWDTGSNSRIGDYPTGAATYVAAGSQKSTP